MYKTRSLIFGFLFLISCIKDEGVPSYIYINSIEVELDNPAEQGSSSSKITDAWVFVNDESAGAYKLPAKIPLLHANRRQLKIGAGIFQNGISATRIIYPFYDFHVWNMELIRDSVLEIKPVVSYHKSTVFKWIEDFEDVGMSLVKDDISDVDIVREQDDSLIYEGSGSGAIHLHSETPIFKLTTQNAYILPKDGSPVYVELDYRNDLLFTMGIIAFTSGGETHQVPIIKVNPSEKWNKIYMNVTPEIGMYPDAVAFQLVFFGELETGSSASIYFDNMKLVHR